MAKLVMFDLDGTILNTLEDIKTSLNYMLEKNGGNKISTFDMKVGLTKGRKHLVEKSLNRSITDIEYAQLMETYSRHYKEHKATFTRPYDGILALLRKLKDAGFLLAVCSNKIHSDTKELILDIFPNTFDYILGRTDTRKRKPSGEMLDHIIKQLNVKRANTIYIGDTMTDMNAAANLDLFKIYVTYGFGDDKYKQTAHGFIDEIVHHADEIYDIVTKRFG